MKLCNSLIMVALCIFVASIALAGPASAQEKSAKPMVPAKTANPMVLVKTNMGLFKIELYPKEAPITVANFLHYVDKKFYDGTIFHRVIPGFVIQGGGSDKNMMQKTTLPPIKNEATNGLKNLKGTLSMARTGEINSATSQFFVNLVDNAALDHVSDAKYGYAVFGKVVEGFEVVEKIATVKTTTKGPYQDVPETPVIMESVTRVLPEKAPAPPTGAKITPAPKTPAPTTPPPAQKKQG
jgi:cyclophilin family peptidyl-prolyl cis-trans isomerase